MLGLWRIRNWLNRPRFRADTKAVRADRLTYLSDERLRRLEGALRKMERRRIPGDIIEFGVAMGGSAIIMAAHARRGRKFHGFDVFGMIPPPTSVNDDPKSLARYDVIRKGESEGIGDDQYYGYQTDLYDRVIASFERHGRKVDGRSISLHKGLFEDTWAAVGIDSIALAHIDCDWYDPVKFCLNAVADKMSVGADIIIDDYNDYGGAKVAVDEFLAERRNFKFNAGENPILTRLF